MTGKRIPIKEAKRIAQEYGYDQVIIMARDVTNELDWFTTYGKTRAMCKEVGESIKNIYTWFEKFKPNASINITHYHNGVMDDQ